jgi:hypothetical protein
MGFLDKAKEVAKQAADKAQEGLQQGSDKINDMQATKKADDLLEALGRWTYGQRVGRDDGRAATEIDRILRELTAHESAHGPIVIVPPVAPPPPVAPAPTPPFSADPGSPAAPTAPPSFNAPTQPAPPPPFVPPPPAAPPS